MMGTTHRLGGLTAGLAVVYATELIGSVDINMPASVLAVSCAVLGSLLPDIDNIHSSISRRFIVAGTIVAIGQRIIRAISYTLPKKQGKEVRAAIGHRGITHSLIALVPALIAAAICYINGASYAAFTLAGITAGMASHLLLDMFSNGVPLFSPFSSRRVTVAKIRTGGVVEWCIRIAAGGIIAVALGSEIMKYGGY